jgi:hypothetical protein
LTGIESTVERNHVTAGIEVFDPAMCFERMRLVRDDISTRVDDLLRRLAGRGG